ncbi:hypothetical protein FHW64_004887 [Variovorax sp. Sphag1AA]|nr:hypothetical protein [Variovorax sp. Sphag1AA]
MFPARSLERAFITLALFVSIAGCARMPAAPEPPPPPVTQIRVIPVLPIDRLRTENKGIPVGVLWQSLADRIKSNIFNEQMESTRLSLGPAFTRALVEALEAQGFQASVLEGVERPPASPDDIDYARIPGADPVLHVYIFELGMHSARFSLDYVPRVNLSASLLWPKSGDLIYGDSIYYGADAKGNSPTSVPGDPRFKWSSFGALTDDPKAVAQSYEVAVDVLAKHIAAQIHEATKPATTTGD